MLVVTCYVDDLFEYLLHFQCLKISGTEIHLVLLADL